MSEHILISRQERVTTLQFNRPEKKNAITVAMYAALADALEEAAQDESVRAVALVGDVDFTAGNDIMDFMAAGGFSQDMPVLRYLRNLSTFPKPIVGGVTGVAIGIGTTMLLHCDAVVAGSGARFSLPFTKLGLVPEAAASLLLPLIAGRMRANWLLLSGEPFNAAQALEAGIVARVTEDADVRSTVMAMCGQLAALPPNAMQQTKRLIRMNVAAAVAETLHEEANAFASALQGSEAREAFMAFMSRR